MYTMWTHLNGRKIIAAYYLQVKLWGYQGYSILTLLFREKGKMFTNLTEPEKSQGRKNVRWQMRGRGLEGRERPVERKRERRGTDKTLDNTRLFSLWAHLIHHTLHQMLSLFHNVIIIFSHSSSPKGPWSQSISTNTSLTAWIKPWRQH